MIVKKNAITQAEHRVVRFMDDSEPDVGIDGFCSIISSPRGLMQVDVINMRAGQTSDYRWRLFSKKSGPVDSETCGSLSEALSQAFQAYAGYVSE